MGRRSCDRNDQPVNFLGKHDAIRDFIGLRDVIEHPQIAFQNDRVTWLSLATGEAVDGKLTDGNAVLVVVWRLVFTVTGNVVLG